MRGLLVLALIVSLGCNGSTAESKRYQAGSLPKESEVVSLTESALAAVRKFKAADPTANYLEVSVAFDDPKTCTGRRYSLSLVSKPSPAEFMLVKANGVDLAINVKSIEFLRGTKIDWIPLADGQEGFYFHNPNSGDTMPEQVRKHYESKESGDAAAKQNAMLKYLN